MLRSFSLKSLIKKECYARRRSVFKEKSLALCCFSYYESNGVRNMKADISEKEEVMSEKEAFMKEALMEARAAYKKGEVPVGAVVVKNGEVIAKAHNLRETEKNALRHAETAAIEKACERLGSWRLCGCDIYVTLEPCHMCIGAIIEAKINNLYFGAYDKKKGAVFSIDEVPKNKSLCHTLEWCGGIMEDECSALIKSFFAELRQLKKENN